MASFQASLAGLPDFGFVLYIGLNCLVWLVVVRAAMRGGDDDLGLGPVGLALLTSLGPVLLAQVTASQYQWISKPQQVKKVKCLSLL